VSARTLTVEQAQMIQDPPLAVGRRQRDRRRQLGVGERRHDVGERTSERLDARAAQHALERVVPQQDAAVVIEDRHALLEVLDHFGAAPRFLEPLHVVAVDLIGEEERRRDHRREIPQPPIQHRHDRHRHAGAEQIERASRQRARAPRAIDGPPPEERHDHARQRALHEVIADDRSRDRRREPRP
jgi:hypothetical protein